MGYAVLRMALPVDRVVAGLGDLWFGALSDHLVQVTRYGSRQYVVQLATTTWFSSWCSWRLSPMLDTARIHYPPARRAVRRNAT